MTAYFDHAATTPMHPEAVAAMLPFLSDRFGNPSGSHAAAREARARYEAALANAGAAPAFANDRTPPPATCPRGL